MYTPFFFSVFNNYRAFHINSGEFMLKSEKLSTLGLEVTMLLTVGLPILYPSIWNFHYLDIKSPVLIARLNKCVQIFHMCFNRCRGWLQVAETKAWTMQWRNWKIDACIIPSSFPRIWNWLLQRKKKRRKRKKKANCFSKPASAQ